VSDLNQRLEQIREMQGKPPMPNPMFIQGFEPGSTPPPPLHPLEIPPDDPMADEFLDGDPPAPVPASPLVPRRPAPPAPAAPPIPPIAFQLVVADGVAAWKGRDVILTVEESNAIKAVVLGALQRELRADLATVGRKRIRKAKAAPEAASSQPRKPGRPRKVTP
jgi:hypothetical protein